MEDNRTYSLSDWLTQPGSLAVDCQDLQQASEALMACLLKALGQEDDPAGTRQQVEEAADSLTSKLDQFDAALAGIRELSAEAHAALTVSARRTSQEAPYPLPWPGDLPPKLMG